MVFPGVETGGIKIARAMRLRALSFVLVTAILITGTACSHPTTTITRIKAVGGNAEAQYMMGRWNANPLEGQAAGITPDIREAAKWFRKAADQGHPEAQYNLGLAYANGQGVARDNVQALTWMNLAARRLGRIIRTRDQLALTMRPDERAKAQLLANAWHPKR
jgi:TPR repeat protein